MFPNILWDLKKFETGTKRPTKKKPTQMSGFLFIEEIPFFDNDFYIQ